MRGNGLAGEAGEEVGGAGYVRGGSPGDPPTTESWGEADLLPCFLGWRAECRTLHARQGASSVPGPWREKPGSGQARCWAHSRHGRGSP